MVGAPCPLCHIDIRTKSNESWKKEASLLFNNKYEYIEEYISSHVHISIKCPIHGIFKQTPANHLSGRGCKQCANELSGFNKTNWINKAKTSRYFDSFKIYVIKCTYLNESFIKIGRTYTTISRRFHSKTRFPYDWELLFIKEYENPIECWDMEIKLHQMYKSNMYIPLLSFGGMSECFQLNSDQINDIRRIIQ